MVYHHLFTSQKEFARITFAYMNGGSKGTKQPNIGADTLHFFREKIWKMILGGALFVYIIYKFARQVIQCEIRIHRTEKKSRITYIGGEGGVGGCYRENYFVCENMSRRVSQSQKHFECSIDWDTCFYNFTWVCNFLCEARFNPNLCV